MSKNDLRFYIKTFGCQMNRADTDVLCAVFADAGMTPAASPDEADLVHIHTCCVRQKAEDKFYSYLGEMRHLKERKPSFILGVGGCIPERTEINRSHPFIDYIIGARNPIDYTDIINSALIRFNLCSSVVQSVNSQFAIRNSQFITVIRGCANYCSYCIVPYVRGGEMSRTPQEIYDEAAALTGNGCREVTLLGQNILAYGEDSEPRRSLIDVIERIHEIEGLRRIRFVTSHPKWVSEDFLARLKNYPKVCEHFHVPCQAGDDEILRRMNRRYTAQEYENTICMIRSHFPDCSITADVIVGFPGETDEQFQNTLRLLERLRVDSAYTFKYSVRTGTAAARMPDSVPLHVKKDRLRILNELQDCISLEINKTLIGTVQEVMVESSDPRPKTSIAPALRTPHSALRTHNYLGRTRTNKVTDFASNRSLTSGEIVHVIVKSATPHALVGEIAEENQRRVSAF
ncbi:MAG: tRNA (N6-isopentenyl adenosine(37)-C2)-methylthiotransferase MiaB [bacterium]